MPHLIVQNEGSSLNFFFSDSVSVQ